MNQFPKLKLGIIMDDISNINPNKDTSFAMLLESQRRGWQNFYCKISDLSIRNGSCFANMAQLEVADQASYYNITHLDNFDLASLDILLVRQDPPINLNYIYMTYMLDVLSAKKVLIINRPDSLRSLNEKIFALTFGQFTPASLVACDMQLILEFVMEQKDVVLKPLNAMGGMSIFRVHANDINLSVILEMMTNYGQDMIIAQKYIPEIKQGDKRIIMVNGEPIPYALARIPADGQLRGNLAAGGKARGVKLSSNDRLICDAVGPTLVEKGLFFVGLDVIGDYLTEINITSPTCVRQLDKIYNLNICKTLFDSLQDQYFS